MPSWLAVASSPPFHVSAQEPHRSPTRNGRAVEQDDSREQVSEGLLSRQADHDSGRRASYGEHSGVEPDHAQRDDDRDRPRHEADEEAERARGAGLHAAHQRRSEGAAEQRGQPVAEEDQQHERPDPHPHLVDLREQRVPHVEDHQDAHDRRDHEQGLDPGTAGIALEDLGGQSGLLPGVALCLW